MTEIEDQMEMANKLLDAIQRTSEGVFMRSDLPGPGEIKDAMEDEGMILVYDSSDAS